VTVTKSRHCAYQTHYYIVFPVKYRKRLLYPEDENTIKKVSEDIYARYEIEFEKKQV